MRPSLRNLQAATRVIPRAKSISFIGLGQMGYRMAYNLFSKQHTANGGSEPLGFVVCDALPDSARAFCSEFSKQFPDAQISIANTPEEAAIFSSRIVTMLPSSPHVQSVYAGFIVPTLQKLHANTSANTICIDSTTLDVDIAREVATNVIKAGAQIIDAPVSGGVTGAQAGTLSFLVGGTQETFEASKPILSLMGQRIIYCGPSGAGLGAKICNNLILGVEQIVVAEAMLLGESLGLDPVILAAVINSSTGGCWSSSANNPVPSALPDKSPPCERDYEGGFATALMLKDMGLATDVAQQRQSPLPMAKAAKELYARIVEKRPELAKKDFSSVYLYLKDNRE
ncbi:3-hydroxyisobutyrate dehydrogenase [Pholiota conissans]|uniref:3-hydroxyisobutyrate dehydrogenase n=1 Tax=Pholiota conissans TaxID=109636 RepID=A0A9P5YWA3_9AGAR|nr:3-hydroxyisobutyrate dehydrogenase [Pholiota conissans]